jgi:hypothetical protein
MAAKTHGMSDTTQYSNWASMHTRCSNPRGDSYPNYGGRGIKVCARWKSFEAFYEDMGPCPKGMQIDRIDNDGDYEPENCRWVTPTRNQRNRRSNRMLTYMGETLCVADWADRLELSREMIYFRLARGWTTERALSTPSMR